MKDVYEVLRQKELEKSRLENEVEALRVVAPILSEDGEAENDNQPTLLPRAVNATPQPFLMNMEPFEREREEATQ